MKNYTITVNGVAYSVTVEETAAGAAPVAAAAPAPAPVAAAPAPAPAKAAAPAAAAGSIEVTAQVPGKVFKIVANVGQAVKAGDSIIILESMKMEIPVVAPEDGTVAGINVAAGDAVESGDLLATMNQYLRRPVNGYIRNTVKSDSADSLPESDRRKLHHDPGCSGVSVFGNCERI
jgi:biotin carboxyl carrier protein